MLLKAPFVCNGYKNYRRQCAFTKHLYYAKEAQKEYESLLVEAREEIPLNKAEFYEMDRIVSCGMKNGQHIYHILQTNSLNVSLPTNCNFNCRTLHCFKWWVCFNPPAGGLEQTVPLEVVGER